MTMAMRLYVLWFKLTYNTYRALQRMVTIMRLNSRTMQMIILKSLEKNVFDAHAINQSGCYC